MVEVNLVRVEGKPFADCMVPVDNMQYVRCRFQNVMFVYSGGPWDFEDCRFAGTSVLRLQGAANWTDLFLIRMKKELGTMLPGPPPAGGTSN